MDIYCSLVRQAYSFLLGIEKVALDNHRCLVFRYSLQECLDIRR